MSDFASCLSPQMAAAPVPRPRARPMPAPIALAPKDVAARYARVFVAEAYLGVQELRSHDLALAESLHGRHTIGVAARALCRGQLCAVKRLHVCAAELSDAAVGAYQDAVRTLTTLRHPNLALFLGATNDDTLYLVYEWVHTSLSALLLGDAPLAYSQAHSGGALSLYQRMEIARGVALAMNWLHDRPRPLVHGRLAPNNVLVTDSLAAKVADYALIDIDVMQRNVLHAPETPPSVWSSPEAMLGLPKTVAGDVYCFALIVYVCVTCAAPYADYGDTTSLIAAVAAGQRPVLPAGCLPSLASLLEDCWHKDPTKRPPFRAIVKRLEVVAIDCAVLDVKANVFWQRTFHDAHSAPWTAFLDALAAHFHLMPARADPRYPHIAHTASVALPPHVSYFYSALELLLVDRRLRASGEGAAIVHLESFGRLVAWLGPFDDNFVSRLVAVVSQPWFHGLVSAEDSERLLLHKPPGTFLIRFSTSAFGVFTISKVSGHQKIQHQRVLHLLDRDAYQIQDRAYFSLAELVRKEADRLQLLAPCTGSRFAVLSSDDRVEGYVVT